jgi:uroporphyrinogen III methyltransferase/synthase
MTVARSGTVYLVGAGPGDPGLLTVHGRALLDACDAVVYDALVASQLVHDRALSATPASLHFVGKRGGDRESTRQDEINALLIQLAREGKAVVRLKGGDPFIFGRGGEEAQALAGAGIPFEVVPGVTAGIAGPAYAGIPVTHRGVAASVTFVTGTDNPQYEGGKTNWSALAQSGGTIVLYMSVARLPEIVAALIQGGLDHATPAAAIEWATTPEQRTIATTLAELSSAVREAKLSAPVITVIGAAAALRDEIRWFDLSESRPLLGVPVLVTRATAQAGSLSDRLRERGAAVTELPALRIEPSDPRRLIEGLARMSTYGHIIFTSLNAVDIVWDTLQSMGGDARAFAGVVVSAVGPSTASALAERGLRADVVPTRFVAEGLLEALASRADIVGARVLYPAAADAREILPDGLRALGASVDVIPIYRSVPDGRGADRVRPAIRDGRIALVTAASASAVRGYVDAVGEDLARRVPVVSIGPVTTEAARTQGLEVVGEAVTSTIPALVDAVVLAVRSGRTGASPGTQPRSA